LQPIRPWLNAGSSIEAEINESCAGCHLFISRTRPLCSGRFRAIILDECLLQADPAATESLFRIVPWRLHDLREYGHQWYRSRLRQVKAAARHEEQLQRQSQIVATGGMRNELKDTMTGLLLALDLACSRQPSDPSLLAGAESGSQLSIQLERGGIPNRPRPILCDARKTRRCPPEANRDVVQPPS